jgi:hypothetical protein
MTLRFHFTPVRLAIGKITNNKCWWGCRGKGNLIHCWWECKLVQPWRKSVWISTPGIMGRDLSQHTVEMVYSSTVHCTQAVESAQVPITKECIKKVWHIHTREHQWSWRRWNYVACRKRNGIRSHFVKQKKPNSDR